MSPDRTAVKVSREVKGMCCLKPDSCWAGGRCRADAQLQPGVGRRAAGGRVAGKKAGRPGEKNEVMPWRGAGSSFYKSVAVFLYTQGRKLTGGWSTRPCGPSHKNAPTQSGQSPPKNPTPRLAFRLRSLAPVSAPCFLAPHIKCLGPLVSCNAVQRGALGRDF